jgi:hypothetical protein
LSPIGIPFLFEGPAGHQFQIRTQGFGINTGTNWERYFAGQDARMSIMAGIAYFVALPFDVADGSIVVGEPVECPSAAAAIGRAKGRCKIIGS